MGMNIMVVLEKKFKNLVVHICTHFEYHISEKC